MIFLVLSGKMIFLFPENIILFFRRKMKDDLSQKYMEHDIFFKCPENMVFPKKIMLEYDLSCISGKMVFFFSENMIFFLWTENERWSFSRNTWRYDIFCIYIRIYKCYKYDITLLQKNQRWSSPEKMHLKLTDILDRILEIVPTTLCTFMETFIGVFIYCFPVKKNQETQYIGLKSDFFFNLFGWRYSAMKNLQFSVPFSLRSCV